MPMEVNRMNDPKTSRSLPVYDELFSQISQLVETSRNEVQRSVNTAMVRTYWHIGQMIFEHEQSGERRAAYGKAQLSTLSKYLPYLPTEEELKKELERERALVEAQIEEARGIYDS